MTTFAAAFVSFHDNEMKISIIEAEDERSALAFLLQLHGIELGSDALSEEELKQLAFNCDSVIGVIKVPAPLNGEW